MKTLAELVVMRDQMFSMLYRDNNLQPKVKFALTLAYTEVLVAIREQSVTDDVRRAA